MQLFLLLNFFIASAFALALPGIGSSISNWAENKGLEKADKLFTEGMKALNDGGPNSAKGLKKLAKGTELLEKVQKLHANRQRLMAVNIDIALNDWKKAKAERLTARKVRKAVELNTKIDALAAKHGQVFQRLN